MSGSNRVTDATKVWTTLITNMEYLQGVLVLEYSLRKAGSKFPLVVLYTDTFPAEGHEILDARGILKQHIPYLLPSVPKEFAVDVRFYDCWSKLVPFSLTEYERIVQLDSDMVVLKNMDELMDISLDPPELEGKGNRIFAASHACVCNPLKKPHYPKDWIPSNCAFTSQHGTPDLAQTTGAPASIHLAIPNGGLQVVNPTRAVFEEISAQLASADTSSWDFADQSLLAEVFKGRWVALPYIYNALKTLRREGVHDAIWRDDQVKNVHYILSPKPWEEDEDTRRGLGEGAQNRDPTHAWWWAINDERIQKEEELGIAPRY